MGLSALILEGGGMRGVYTAGVLDYFMEKKLSFNSIYGVSAGALNGANYKSGQIGRSINTFTGYMGDPRYSGLRYLIKNGDWFNTEFVYGTIPWTLDKVDWETFRNNPTNLYAVVSNIVSGRAEYLPVRDAQKEMDILRASASLPALSKPVSIGGQLYLDGGVCDSIPLRKSISDNHEKNLVILTRHKGYVKTAGASVATAELLYRGYPRFRQAMKSRHVLYNSQVRYAYAMEKEGKAFVICPKEEVKISRLEKDKKKLWDLYNKGFRDGKENYERVLEYLNG